MNDDDLRNLFACCALIGLAGQQITSESKAKMCYELADAMVNEMMGNDGIVAIKRAKRKPTSSHQEV
jgi:hypothetical protein